jgi:hypothetical protein
MGLWKVDPLVVLSSSASVLLMTTLIMVGIAKKLQHHIGRNDVVVNVILF